MSDYQCFCHIYPLPQKEEFTSPFSSITQPTLYKCLAITNVSSEYGSCPSITYLQPAGIFEIMLIERMSAEIPGARKRSLFLELNFSAGLALAGVLESCDSSVGVTGTVRIPFTAANITAGIALGKPERNQKSLPAYAQRDLNMSDSAWEWYQGGHLLFAGEQTLFILGKQKDAPLIDLHVSFIRDIDRGK
jgi:hypothetical protein